MINLLDPKYPYSAADFCRDAHREITTIHAAGRTPLLVGGSMLYYRALQQGLSELPQSVPELREALQQKIVIEGLATLYAELMHVDPLAAMRIQATDTQRILRALEVFKLTGKTLSSLQNGGEESKYEFINIGLIPPDRSLLHQSIAERFQHMLVQGFIDEVEHLKSRGDLNENMPSMRAVGYRQIWEYLSGTYDYNEMVERGIAATRQLAKRQLTWLRSWPNLVLWDSQKMDDLLKGMLHNDENG